MRYSALKGVRDVFPPEIHLWQRAETLAAEVFRCYGFQEIRPPVIEPTELFTRSIGEATDIVEKEMYTFPDRAGRSITLRPEGTAPVVRAYIENRLHGLPAPQKFYYSGPMFRYERPQKGRFRQFYQIGAEAFGLASPELDGELLAMLYSFLKRLGLQELRVEINSIGCNECRPGFRQAILEFFASRLDGLCPDCGRRYETNPLRILDCKVERCAALRHGSPKVADFLCAGCRGHFDAVRESLGLRNVPYVVNQDLVRGLDYYTRTTFEVTSEHLGAQKAVAAGGRYDRLVEEFGGPPTPAIGFAVGMERLTALLGEAGNLKVPAPDVFIATLGGPAVREAVLIAEKLRSSGFWAEVAYDNSSLKSQLRRADRLAARYAFVIGDDEIASGRIRWKNLRSHAEGDLPAGDLAGFISGHLV